MNCRPLYRMLAAALAASSIGAAAAAGAPETAGQGDPGFQKLDVNRDGYLSREEARAARGYDKAFTEADDNRDGRLDATEFVKAQAISERALAGQFVDDSLVTAKVKAALLKDSLLSVIAVSVETHKGTVLLSGFVDNENQSRRAAEIAAGVEGVVSVKNSLSVKS